MKKLLFAASLGTLLLAGTAAYADDANPQWFDYGTVTSVGSNSIQLGNGNTYQALHPEELQGLRPGDKVDLWINGGYVYSINRG